MGASEIGLSGMDVGDMGEGEIGLSGMDVGDMGLSGMDVSDMGASGMGVGETDVSETDTPARETAAETDSDELVAPCCEFIHVHEEAVKSVLKVMPEPSQLQNLAAFFRIFGDSTRIRVLYALSQSELCVCDLANLLGMGQSAISHQLRILKQERLVKFRRAGKSVMYSLADSHIETILAQGMEHINE